jgi:hypothetical protein
MCISAGTKQGAKLIVVENLSGFSTRDCGGGNAETDQEVIRHGKEHQSRLDREAGKRIGFPDYSRYYAVDSLGRWVDGVRT